MKYISADFETISDVGNNIIYSWAVNNPYEKRSEKTTTYVIKKGYAYGIDMKGFLGYIKSLTYKCHIFFHNGAKFDLAFVLPRLKENGYTQFIQETKEIVCINENRFKEDNAQPLRKLLPMEYRVLIEKNKIMQLDLATHLNKRGNVILQTFRDSNLLFPNSLAGYGEQIGLEKLEPDEYKMETYKTVKALEKDSNQLEYLLRDVDVLQKYLDVMHTKLDSKHWMMTIASTSYKQWITILGKKLIAQKVKDGIIKEIEQNEKTKFKLYAIGKRKPLNSTAMSKMLIKNFLPVKWQDEPDEEYNTLHNRLMLWYKGGMTMVNPIYKGLILEDITSIDINSSYPSIMNSDLPMPYGQPIDHGEDDEYNLVLYEIKTIRTIKNTLAMPFLPYLTGERLKYDPNLPIGIYYLTETELERFKKYYKYKDKCVITPKFWFRSKPAKEIFGVYVDYFYELKNKAKQDGDKPNEIINKLLLNSLYGKFASKSEREGSFFNDETEEYEKDLTVVRANKYLPIAIWITAYARMKLVDAVNTNYKHFVYCDTDSIFIDEYHKEKFDVDINSSKLGAWDYELIKGQGMVRRSKQYFYTYMDGKEKKGKLAFAGMNLKEDTFMKKDFINKFIYGTIIPDQTQVIRTPSGKVIIPSDKEIFPIWAKHYIDKDDWFHNEDEYFTKHKEQLLKVMKIRKKG